MIPDRKNAAMALTPSTTNGKAQRRHPFTSTSQ